MDNCNKKCSDCTSELSVILSDIPSKWRDQMVKALCNTITNWGVCCTDVLTCANNELDTLDYACLAESSAEWEAYSFLQKIQKIIDKACEDAASGPDFSATSNSLVITPGGDQGHEPNIELVPSSDDDNILTLGSDGFPYVPDQVGVSPALVANDSTSINFTNGGTIGHTLTGVVILDPSENNLIVNNGTGLLVDGTALEVPLTFNNGLTRNVDTVQLGGTLIQSTTIAAAAFPFAMTHTLGTDNLINSQFFSSRWQSGSIGTELISAFSETPTGVTIQNALLTDFNSNTDYYTNGILSAGSGSAVLGFNYPADNGGSPPSDDLQNTSYVRSYRKRIDLYGNQIHFFSRDNTQTTGSITAGYQYEILDNSGGADFTGSGSADNVVGTRFTSNGTTPTWGTGSLRLIGNVTSHVLGPGTSYCSFNNTDRSFDIGAYDDATDYYLAHISSYRLWEAQIRELGVNPVSYYTIGQIYINANSNVTVIGHYTPTSNDILTPAPAKDSALTSMTVYEDGAASHYAAAHYFEGQILIKDIDTGGTVVASAAHEIRSTTRGFLPPRMTSAQRTSIASPATGLTVYQTNGTVGIYVYDGSVWRRLNWT